MLAPSGFPLYANAYEKEKLGWVKTQYPVVNITGNITNPTSIEDFVTTGRIYKYHPSNGNSNEYFYFENHQKLNMYDDVTNNPNDKGIFILHQGGGYNSQSDIMRVETSNGRWNWLNPSTATCFGVSGLPSFKVASVNRAGYDNRDKLPKSGGGTEWLFSLLYNPGQGWPFAGCGGWLHGYDLNNSFNTTYNDVFSPYSNPYTNTWYGYQNNFTMEVSSQNGSVVYTKFYLSNPLAGKPSKPTGVKFGKASSGKNPLVKITGRLTLENKSFIL